MLSFYLIFFIMITRQEYMKDGTLFSSYYGQFVTNEMKELVLRHIGLKTLLASTDEYLNDIQLMKWDRIGHQLNKYKINDAMKTCGDFASLAGTVCILKTAAFQIIEEAKNADQKSV